MGGGGSDVFLLGGVCPSLLPFWTTTAGELVQLPDSLRTMSGAVRLAALEAAGAGVDGSAGVEEGVGSLVSLARAEIGLLPGFDCA